MDNPVVIPLLETSGTAPASPAAPTPRSLLLGGIFVLILLCCIKAASEIVIPIVLAVLLNMVFQPVVRLLAIWKLPPTMIACIIITVLISAIVIINLWC